MPLILISRSPAVHPDGYEIAASSRGNGSSIRIIVTREAINTAAPHEPYLERLKVNLERFREIASRKYDADKIEQDGSILIKPQDVTDIS